MLVPLAPHVPVADPSPTPSPGTQLDPQQVAPGLLGFIFFVLLAVATYLIWRSMNKQLTRIRVPEDGATPGADGPAAPTAQNPRPTPVDPPGQA